MKIVGRQLIVEIPKELDHHSSEIIRGEADKLIENNNINCVVFDFQKTEFMDSSGIGVILGRYKLIRRTGGNVVAINLNNQIKKIFVMSGLKKVIRVYENE